MNSVALSDSVTAVVSITTFFSTVFPWLDSQVVNWLAHALGAIPIVAIIIGWEVVGKLLNKVSPLIRDTVGNLLSQYSWIINPLLGGLIGGNMGDSSLGLVAGAVWGIIRKSPLGGTTTFGLSKAKNVVAIIAVMLCLLITGNSYAQTFTNTNSPEQREWIKTLSQAGILKASTFTTQSEYPLLSPKRLTYAIGVGEKYIQFSEKGYPNDKYTFAAGQVGYTISDFLGIRSRVDKNISKQEGDPWNIEVSLWGIF